MGTLERLLHNSKQKGENALYDQLRNETELTANPVQRGIRRALEAAKSDVARLKKGDDTNQPHFDAWSVLYDKRSPTFHRDHGCTHISRSRS